MLPPQWGEWLASFYCWSPWLWRLAAVPPAATPSRKLPKRAEVAKLDMPKLDMQRLADEPRSDEPRSDMLGRRLAEKWRGGVPISQPSIGGSEKRGNAVLRA